MATTFRQSGSLRFASEVSRELAVQMTPGLSGQSGIVSTIPPLNGNGAATSGDPVDMRNWDKVVFQLVVGVIDETIDFELQESETSGGSYDTVPGKTVTQLPGTADGKAVQIEVRLRDLTTDHLWVKPVVTVGNGTSSLVSVIGTGFGPKNQPLADIDLADVLQIVPSKSGLFAAFFTNPVVPGVNTDMDDFTLSANFAGVPLDSLVGPTNSSDGGAYMTQLVQVVADGPPTEENLKGCVVYRLIGGVASYVFSDVFGVDVPIINDADSLAYTLRIPTNAVRAA